MMDQDLTIAIARADQQVAHVDSTIDHLLRDATDLIAKHGETGAWALLALRINDQLSDRSQFMAEMLSRMAIKAARQS